MGGGGGGAGKLVAGSGSVGAKVAAGGGGGGATGPCRYVRRFATAVARSRTAADSSAGERMGGGSAPGAECSAAVVTGGDPEVTATVAVVCPDDMIETEESDTKLVETRDLPGLTRRLYGWNGGGRGDDRARRRAGAVVRERRRKAATRAEKTDS